MGFRMSCLGKDGPPGKLVLSSGRPSTWSGIQSRHLHSQVRLGRPVLVLHRHVLGLDIPALTVFHHTACLLLCVAVCNLGQLLLVTCVILHWTLDQLGHSKWEHLNDCRFVLWMSFGGEGWQVRFWEDRKFEPKGLLNIWACGFLAGGEWVRSPLPLKNPERIPSLLLFSSWLWLRDVDYGVGLHPVLGSSGETLTLQVSGPDASEGRQELGQEARNSGERYGSNWSLGTLWKDIN